MVELVYDVFTDEYRPLLQPTTKIEDWLDSFDQCNTYVASEGPGLPSCDHRHKYRNEAVDCARSMSIDRGVRHFAITRSAWFGYCPRAPFGELCACTKSNWECGCSNCKQGHKSYGVEQLESDIELIEKEMSASPSSEECEILRDTYQRLQHGTKNTFSYGYHVRLPHRSYEYISNTLSEIYVRTKNVPVQWRDDEESLTGRCEMFFPDWLFRFEGLAGILVFSGYSYDQESGLTLSMVFDDTETAQHWVERSLLPKMLRLPGKAAPESERLITWEDDKGSFEHPDGDIRFEWQQAGKIFSVTATDASDDFEVGMFFKKETDLRNWAEDVARTLRP